MIDNFVHIVINLYFRGSVKKDRSNMSNVALKQVHYQGITMQIPEVWKYETEEYNEEDGTKSYSLSISAKG